MIRFYMRGKLHFIILYSIFCLSTQAQKHYPVLKGYAFYHVNMPGLNKMDEYGNSLAKIDTTYFLYLITIGKVEPKIEEVIFNQSIYLASVFKIDDKDIIIGKLKGVDKIIKIKAERGQFIWKIELQMQNNNRIFKPREYNKFKVIFQKNLHWQSFEIPAGLELQPEEHN